MIRNLCPLQPFNQGYNWQNTSQNMIIPDTSISTLNTYQGGITQQATSVVTATNQQCYQLDGACFSVYGFEVSLYQLFRTMHV